MKNRNYRLSIIFIFVLVVQSALAADENDLLELVSNTKTASAALAFTAAYDSLSSIDDDKKAIVADYYHNNFSAIYLEANDVDPHVDDVISNLSERAYYLQYYYIAANPEGLAAKEDLDQADGGSSWSAVHAVFHPFFLEELKNRDLYDFFIVNEVGDIVYTVYKETDLGTNLEDGSFADSGLGQAYRKAKSSSSLAISNVEPYWPSYDFDSQFVCAPTGKAIACLQITPDQLVEFGDIRN